VRKRARPFSAPEPIKQRPQTIPIRRTRVKKIPMLTNQPTDLTSLPVMMTLGLKIKINNGSVPVV